jgi:hypothetical protein
MTTGRINQVAAILRTPLAAPSRKQPTAAKGIRRPEPHDWMSVVLAWILQGIHPHAGPCPPGAPPAQLSLFARLSIQPRHRRRCGTQAPSLQRCESSRRRVCCAGSRPRRTSPSVRTSCSGGAGVPAGFPLVFNKACTSCIGTSSQHLGRGLLCWRGAGPNGRSIFRM